HPRVAPRHMGMMLRPLDWVYTALFNALEMPATAVRTGSSREGLPLGVQIVARRGLDRTSIAAGVAIESALGGFRLPKAA
ncbi:MAG: amidase, partial [Polyangiales bacterium]